MVNLLVDIPENPHNLREEKKTIGKSRNKIKGKMALSRGGYERLHRKSLTNNEILCGRG